MLNHMLPITKEQNKKAFKNTLLTCINYTTQKKIGNTFHNLKI